MELLLPHLLAYLISIAAGLRTGAISERRQENLRLALEEESTALAAINSTKSLKEQLVQIGSRIGKLTTDLNVEDNVEQAIWQLLADPIFCDDLAQWLTLWDLPDSEEMKSRLDAQIVSAMQSAGAQEARVATFQQEFFNLVDNLVFEDGKLARWRHNLGLQALKQDHEEILRRLREQDGEYEPQRIEEALETYRTNTLKTCDIIDLAGLPEDDRHLAMQDFVLRQLYIPLRVELEGPLEFDDNDTSEDDLEKMEDRRQQRRLDAAGRPGDTEQSKAGNRIAVADILRANRRAVILGDPGGGKTTLVRWFATAFLLRLDEDPSLKELPDVDALPVDNWIPILIRCRDLPHDAHQCDMDEILTQAVRASEVPSQLRGPLIAGLRQQLENGSALLMVDGLDEIQDPMLRARFCRRLEALAVIYDKTSILVTSRIVGYREMRFRMGRDFRHATICDLTPEEMDDFAQRWIATTEAKKTKPQQMQIAKKLIEDIHSSDRVERLAGNPMLLTTLALVHRKVGRLPQRRVDLYREAVQVLLNWRREIDEPLDWAEAVPQLEYIAHAMCSRGVQRLTRGDVINLLEEMRGIYKKRLREIENRTSTKFLDLLEKRSGILIEAGVIEKDGQEQAVYEFRHLTFQEYLAGLALIDGRFSGHVRGSRLAERLAPLAGQIELGEYDLFGKQETVVSENWREALRLCLADCNDDDVDDSLRAILNPMESEKADDIARPRAIMAALCLADEPNVLEDVALRVLECVAGLVRLGDGGGSIDSSMSAAIMELGRSVWVTDLQRALVSEFRCRDKSSSAREVPGSLAGMVGAQNVPEVENEFVEWLAGAGTLLSGHDENASLQTALTIMQLAFQNRIRNFSGVTEALLIMTRLGSDFQFSSIWALHWLSGGWVGQGVWTPSPDEIRPIMSILLDRKSDSLIRLIGPVMVGKSGAVDAAGPLTLLLEDENPRIRKYAVAALVNVLRIQSLDQDALLMADENSTFAGLDPSEPINEERIVKMAKKLGLSIEDVRNLYERHAPTFKLKLEWKSD